MVDPVGSGPVTELDHGPAQETDGGAVDEPARPSATRRVRARIARRMTPQRVAIVKPVLEPLAPWFEEASDPEEGYAVARDYSVVTRDDFRPRVYLQGYCEPTHGISETVLSLLPIRAQDIYRSLLAELGDVDPVEAAMDAEVPPTAEPVPAT